MANVTPAPGKIEAGMGQAILLAADMAAGKVNMAIVEQDYGVATAVTTAIIASAEVDGEILAAFLINTELAHGSTNAGQTWLLIGSTQASIKSAEFTVAETVYKNVLSAVTGLPQHGTEGNRQFDRGDAISAYTEAESGRDAGKYFVVLLWKER
jgi:hypothetical protein